MDTTEFHGRQLRALGSFLFAAVFRLVCIVLASATLVKLASLILERSGLSALEVLSSAQLGEEDGRSSDW